MPRGSCVDRVLPAEQKKSGGTVIVSSCYYMCPHTTLCVLMLLYVSSYYYICLLMLLYVSSYYYIRALVLLYLDVPISWPSSSYYYIYVLILPHTTVPRRANILRLLFFRLWWWFFFRRLFRPFLLFYESRRQRLGARRISF